MISAWRSLSCLALILSALTTRESLLPQLAMSNPPPMFGRPIEEPERFSGLWEAADGLGGTVGIWLQLTTRIQGAPTTLTDVIQYDQTLLVAVFQPNGNRIEFPDGSFVDQPGGQLMWDGKHLRAQRGLRNKDASTTQLDLTYDATKETWSGLFRRGTVARTVTFRRPAYKPDTVPNAFVGTWANTEKGSHGCFHIVQQADGTFMGWLDGLQTPGTYRYANGLKPSSETFEQYGNLLLVSALEEQKFAIEFGAYSGICCSKTLIAKVTKDASLVGDWQLGPNQVARHTVWKRLSGRSCRVQE